MNIKILFGRFQNNYKKKCYILFAFDSMSKENKQNFVRYQSETQSGALQK